MVEPTTAKTKKKVEMNSAMYALRALRVTDCSNRAASDVRAILISHMYIYSICMKLSNLLKEEMV